MSAPESRVGNTTSTEFAAEWTSFDEDTGEQTVHEITTESILGYMAEGLAPKQIQQKTGAPLVAIEHCIMLIPKLMVERDRRLHDLGIMLLPR